MGPLPALPETTGSEPHHLTRHRLALRWRVFFWPDESRAMTKTMTLTGPVPKASALPLTVARALTLTLAKTVTKTSAATLAGPVARAAALTLTEALTLAVTMTRTLYRMGLTGVRHDAGSGQVLRFIEHRRHRVYASVVRRVPRLDQLVRYAVDHNGDDEGPDDHHVAPSNFSIFLIARLHVASSAYDNSQNPDTE